MGHHTSRDRNKQGQTVRARTLTEVKQTADYIEALAQSLRAGGVTIRSGTELVALRLGDRIEFQLEAGKEGRQSVVHLSLRWETPVSQERLDITPGVKEQPGPLDPAQNAPSGEESDAVDEQRDG
jgi:amphi-Trp domain-containing protein